MLLDLGFLVLASGDKRLAFPGEAVRGLASWSEPKPLPGAAPWVGGLLLWEGEIWPVVKETFWGLGSGEPEVYAFISRQGRVIAIPGRSPQMVPSGSQAGAKDLGAGPWSGEVGVSGQGVPCVDVDRLYLALGLN